mgnify:CR=1 FL=1
MEKQKKRKFLGSIVIIILIVAYIFISNAIAAYARTNKTTYGHTSGYYTIKIHKGNSVYATYKISSSIGRLKDSTTGSSWLNTTVTKQSGTDCLSLNSDLKSFTIADGAVDESKDGLHANERQYGLQYYFKLSNLPEGYDFDCMKNSGTQVWVAYTGNSAINFIIDTNETGMTNWGHGGTYYNATLDIYLSKFSYHIDYYGNGGRDDSNNSLIQSTVKYGDTIHLLENTFKRTGYDFENWNTSTDGTGITYKDKQEVKNLGTYKDQTIDLRAQWTPHTYTVTYKGNGGKCDDGVSVDDTSHTYDVESKLAKNAFKKTGYHFYSWNRQADGTGDSYKSGEKVKNLTAKDGVTLKMYAIWEANKYTVYYDKNQPADSPNDVEGEMSYTTHTYDVDKALLSNKYSLVGYKFTGWNTKANGTGTSYSNKESVKNLTTKNDGTVTLYAQWKINQSTLTIDPNGGTWNNKTTIQNFKQNYNTTKSIPNPTRTGYTFTGWTKSNPFTVGNLSGTTFTFGSTSGGAGTLTAGWKINSYLQQVYVRYQNVNGSWGNYSEVTNKKYDYGSTVSWSRAADATYKAASISYTVTAAKTSHVDVYRNTHTVTLNKGTGIDSVTGAGTYYHGQTATINATLTVGYKWINWTGTTTYSNISNSFTVDGDKTFTANAEPITYKVRFNGNGNWNTSQGSYTQQFTYDLPATLTPNKFTRPDNTTYNSVNYIKGYEFIGWETSATQTTATYTNGQSVINLKNTDGAVLDLYAIWKKPVTLTFNFNGGKFNDSTANQVLNYTMYNSELNHTFDIKTYYGGFKNNRISANKGINNKLTKTDTNGIQYRFLGYSLNKNATVPDTQFDVYSLSRTENYTIRDNTTLYAVWEPILQMTVQLSAPQHSGVMQLTSDIPVTTTLGNFKIPSGTRSTDIPSSATASVNTATIGTNVTNKDLITYTVSAKGASNIKFSTAADSRILDIYTHGNNNTWFDKLNTTDKFEYTIDNFSNTTSSFTIPQYIGTKKSYKTSNPESATGTSVYAIKFTCTQPSYYYSKYWNSPESTSVYGILFLNPTLPDDNTNGGIILPPYAVEDGAYEFETILN